MDDHHLDLAILRVAVRTARAYRRCMLRQSDATTPEVNDLLGALEELARLCVRSPRMTPHLHTGGTDTLTDGTAAKTADEPERT